MIIYTKGYGFNFEYLMKINFYSPFPPILEPSSKDGSEAL